MKRRERTRNLIELGGLVVKADLIELADDDRAVLLGLMIEAAATLRSERREQALALWRRRGKRAFEESAANENLGTGDKWAP
ncbi:conjugal transfer protein TraD [Sphingomonas koreensis]